MPANSYHFVEHWIIPDFPPEAVWEVLADARLLPEWWRGVYLAAEPLEDYPEPVVGAKARVRARGFLPYTLSFLLEATAMERNRVVEVTAHGDFEGIWRATLSPEGAGTRVDIDWRVVAQKPIIRWLSPLLKPLFAANHNWTTPRGEAGLRAYLEMQRRQGRDG